jgi:predicted  nucleic acid-binding Zn-ribbon protein
MKKSKRRHLYNNYLQNHLQAETEKTTQIQQRQRTMAFQLQALDERSQQLNVDISGSRDKILEITKEIEGMRERRDEKCAKIQELERKTKEVFVNHSIYMNSRNFPILPLKLNVQSERISHENLQLQSECQRQLSRTHEIEALRNEVIEIDEQIKRIETEAAATGEKAMNQEKAVIEV